MVLAVQNQETKIPQPDMMAYGIEGVWKSFFPFTALTNKFMTSFAKKNP